MNTSMNFMDNSMNFMDISMKFMGKYKFLHEVHESIMNFMGGHHLSFCKLLLLKIFIINFSMKFMDMSTYIIQDLIVLSTFNVSIISQKHRLDIEKVVTGSLYLLS
jgi:hypothetical protein